MINDLATDLSLRGLTSGLGDVLLGIQSEKVKLDDVAPTFDKFSKTIEDVVAGTPASFSWRELAQQQKGPVNDRRGFIDVRPMLDYAALEPGRAATGTIRNIAAEIAPKYQATVRLTGPVPMADEEFATVKEGALRNGLITIAIVLFILWMALRSARLILRGVRQRVHRTCAHRRGRPCNGRLAQSDFDVVRGAVHRHRRRFRHSIQRALPRRASRVDDLTRRNPAMPEGSPACR